MSKVPRPARPSTYTWFVSIIGGCIALILVPLFFPELPVTDPQAAMRAIPKLRDNAACVISLRDVGARHDYVLSYVNLTIWWGVAGLVLGAFLVAAENQFSSAASMSFRHRPTMGLAEKPEQLTAGTWEAARERLAGLLGKLLLRIVAIFGLVALFFVTWWVTFYASSCWMLERGYPEYRAFQHMPPFGSAFFFFLVGVACATCAKLLWYSSRRVWRGKDQR